MFRWMIEKDGTGIERSGTGIEKSGTGIEKSGTGIEKSGTGIRRELLACSMAAVVFAGNLHAGNIDPAGSLQLVVQNIRIAVSWIIGDSVFSGIASLEGSYANLMLTEVALSATSSDLDVTGNGTGSNIQVTGNGTGSKIQVTGNGTGSKIQVTRNGTGSKIQVTGNGTGSKIQVTGNGTGMDAITITLPEGTGLAMEVSLGRGFANVAVIDANSVQVVAFDRVPVIGGSDYWSNGFGSEYRYNLGTKIPFN